MTAQPAAHAMTQEELLRRYQQAWTELDVDTIVELMTPDALYEASFGPEPWGERFVGHEAIRRILVTFRDSPNPSSHDYVDTYHFGDHAFATWVSGELRPDGTRVPRVHGCDLYEFRDGLVSRKIAFRKGAPR